MGRKRVTKINLTKRSNLKYVIVFSIFFFCIIPFILFQHAANKYPKENTKSFDEFYYGETKPNPTSAAFGELNKNVEQKELKIRRAFSLTDESRLSDGNRVSDRDEDMHGTHILNDGNNLRSDHWFNPDQMRIYKGFVMHELCRRILSRSVAQSNVLVVSPGMNISAPLRLHAHLDMKNEFPFINPARNPAQVILQRSIENGHTVHLVPSNYTSNLNDWWENDHVLKAKAKWFLLAYFLPSSPFIASICTASNNAANVVDDANIVCDTGESNSIDAILHPSNVGRLLSNATLTYIIVGIRSRSSTHDRYMQGNNSISMEGITAVQTLLDANYKVQLLSSSHYVEVEKKCDNLNDNFTEKSYQPNYLFKSRKDVQDFLFHGAKMAAMSKRNVGNQRERVGKELKSVGDQFEALLFATQGLDLAIPSRLSYVTVKNLDTCVNGGTFERKVTGGTTYKPGSGRCDAILNAAALGQDIFLSCPLQHRAATIEFCEGNANKSNEKSRRSDTIDVVKMKLNGKVVHEDENGIELWLGHDNPREAETACMRSSSEDIHSHKVSCTSRILRKSSNVSSDSRVNHKLNNNKMHSLTTRFPDINVLFILIDPISRSQLQRSLPNTAVLLEKLNFTHFGRYSVVGDNSGPNQAALFTGWPLVGGRDGIKHSMSHAHDTNSTLIKWVWDEFNEIGYATLKSEDSCVHNSNMVQSMKPRTTHGDQLSRMFCFEYDRPNCLGKDMAASHLLNYTKEFIKAYSGDSDGSYKRGIGSSELEQRPWAAFLSFDDAHEDSLTLISYIDEMFVDFLQEIDFSTTMVMFASDHGLHYGPSFLSNGERERAEPILYVRLPEDLDSKHHHALKKNSDYWTTPFDVHETIMDIALHKSRESSIGTSLLKELPKSRNKCELTPGIPARFCSLLESKQKQKQCTFMPEPPSVLSFYADILRDNRVSWPGCKKQEKDEISTMECLCATHKGNSKNYWLPCNHTFFEEMKSQENPLSMKTCQLEVPPNTEPQHSMEIKIDINPQKNILVKNRGRMHRYKERTRGTDLEPLPNILFIEIDSLSEKAASRHLSKTLSVLSSYKIVREEGKRAHCPRGLCAAKFNRTSVVGKNSIPNQLAALSGCTNRNVTSVDSYQRKIYDKKVEMENWCPKNLPENPWIFRLAEERGYVTFFGEEFCDKNSPFVVQNKIFYLDADYSMTKLFCQLAKAIQDQNNQTGIGYGVEHDTSRRPRPCVDGRSRQEFAFEYIRGIWDAYPDLPKFAYLNTLAAHDYSVDLAYQPLGLEAYDDYLSEFLEEMLRRPDANNTVIVLRSDHGLQGGVLPIDFSVQVEHMHPFNSLIVPETFLGLSHDALFDNQNRLVTGYDLYNVLRYAIASRSRSDGRNVNERERLSVPDWSYNLLEESVPENRTCDDAKVPVEFCPCLEEREDLMPYFHVGQAEKLNVMKSAQLNWNSKTSRYEAVALPGKSNTSRR